MGRQRILYILLPSLQPQVREINCFTSSLVSWLIRELQKAKGGMFLKISKIWKDTSANNYGQPFSNFWNWNVLGLQLNSARFESTECPQDWVSMCCAAEVKHKCKPSAAQSISEPALPPWSVRGAAGVLGSVQKGVAPGGVVTAWKALPEEELKVTNHVSTREHPEPNSKVLELHYRWHWWFRKGEEILF